MSQRFLKPAASPSIAPCPGSLPFSAFRSELVPRSALRYVRAERAGTVFSEDLDLLADPGEPRGA